MRIRCWGSRGSIPVSGREYLKYGGDTTCLEIRSRDGDLIILDAGSGIRKLGNQLLAEKAECIHILFTHSHWDHLLGFPFFKPLYKKGTRIEVYGCTFAQESIKNILSNTMQPPYFPVNLSEVKASINYHQACRGPFSIGKLIIKTIPLSHPNRGVGYKITEDEKHMVFLTDNELSYKHPGGLTFQEYEDFSRGADILIHDAEFSAEEYETC